MLIYRNPRQFKGKEGAAESIRVEAETTDSAVRVLGNAGSRQTQAGASMLAPLVAGDSDRGIALVARAKEERVHASTH